MLDILIDAIIDTLKLIPFLFITYLIMEYIENKTSDKAREKIKKTGKCGPLFGGILGVVPQCGFSASSTSLYAGGLITIGTLMAVYLSTSDEMVPILISKAIPITTIIKILSIKLVFGVIWGFIIDFAFRIINKGKEHEGVDICEEEHCNCEENGILKASLIHTVNIAIYIFIITLIIDAVIQVIGEEAIENFIGNNSFLGPMISSLIGLIPNCAASVIITDLYIQNIINAASLIAGLLTGAGVGLIVLFRINKNHLKENISIVAMLYAIGVISGWILQLVGLNI